MDYLVGARMTDGKIEKFRAHEVGSEEEAREMVRMQVPRAKVILALVDGGKAAPGPVEKVAA